MATNIQRTVAICDALVNGTSTAEQQTLLAQALWGIGLGNKPYAELTNAEKAAVIPDAVRAWAVSRVRDYNYNAAVRAAIVALPDPEVAFPEA